MSFEELLYLNLTTIEAARPDTLDSAADLFDGLASALSRHGERLHQEVRRPLGDGSWTGEANTAAVVKLGRIMQRWGEAETRMSEVAQAVRTFAGAMRSVQSYLADLQRVAAQNQLAIDADGSVNIVGGDVFELLAIKAQLEERITELRKAATEADVACARVFGLPESDDDGGTKWSDWWGRLGNVSSGLTVYEGVQKILPFLSDSRKLPGVPKIPGLPLLGFATSVDGLMDEWHNFNDPATRREGIGEWAQAFKIEFMASSAAFSVVPHPYVGLAPLVTGALWGGANLLDTHWGTIRNVWDAGWEAGGHATGAARDVWDEGWRRGSDLLGGALDTGGEVLGDLGDATGAVGDAASGAWHSVFG